MGAGERPFVDVNSFANMIAPSNEPSIDSLNENDFVMKDDEPSLFDEEAMQAQQASQVVT